MKNLYFFLFILLLCFPAYAQLVEGDEPNPEEMLEQDPTYENLPLPSEILVVYNEINEQSESVANYYKEKRDIPSINLCPITKLPEYVDYGEAGGAYLENGGEKIISWTPEHDAEEAHWLYYKDYIETPIKNYMETNNLTDTIRYIVMIKGLPFRLQRDPYHLCCRRINAAICALLSLMNQPDERDIMTLYNTSYNT